MSYRGNHDAAGSVKVRTKLEASAFRAQHKTEEEEKARFRRSASFLPLVKMIKMWVVANRFRLCYEI